LRCPAKLGRLQGDQIGRIFAFWAIFFFGQFFETYKSSPIFLATDFFHVKICVQLTINGLGYIFVRFFHKLIWSPSSFGQDVEHVSMGHAALEHREVRPNLIL
jgi:hypothetical protein